MFSLLARQRRWLLVSGVLLLLLAACSTSGDGADDPADASKDGQDEGAAPDADDDSGESSGGEFSIFVCEPQTLIPGAAGEICGVQVLEALFTGLVQYDAESGAVVEGAGLASSIESDDQQQWTITLKDGFTFHNGEPVTAASFVDAWNWMANPANEMGNAFFLATAGFEGFGEVASGDAETMSGLEVTGDLSFEVTLDAPFGPFVQMLGHNGFFPLPDAFYEDPAAFENAPIGNGPFMMDGEWERGEQIRMVRFDDFAGEPAKADAVTFRIYSDAATGYLDFEAGDLDIHPQVPPDQRADASDTLGERYLDQATSSYAYLGFPLYDEAWQDENLRRAISMAIDREAIIEQILGGTEVPATSVLPPTLEAHRSDACEYCMYDPEQAAELYAESGGAPDPLKIYFNSGAGHDEPMEAISNQLRQNLGIENIEFVSLAIPDYIPILIERQADGPFRVGWSLAYPSPQYALEPLFATTGSTNDMAYSNEDFDRLVSEANATSGSEATELYQQAEDILLGDMPIVPLWYTVDGIAWSERVSGVVPDRSMIRVWEVEVTE